MPSASNLALGELAINIADGKLYYNSSGTIKLIAANLVPIANGGTFSTTIPTAGAIAYGDGSAYQFTAVGTTGQLLTSAGVGVPTWSNIADIAVTSLNFGTTGLTPTTATKGAITVAGTLAVANGGTGLTSTPANGALDIGNGTGFTRATLTAGSGVSITNGSGSISISATGSGGTVTSVSVVSANGFAGTVATATTTPAITLTTSVTGVLKGNGTAISAATANTDYQGVSAPVTKTADFTVVATDIWLINNKTGSTCTVTLPTASSWSGRVLRFLNYQAQTVVSASSNVVPLTGGAAATSILLASTGDSVTLVSDGSNWLMTQYIPNNILLLE